METFIGTKKKKEQTSDKVVHDVLAYWVSFFGTPCIILPGGDSRFIGSHSHNFATGDITLQTFIHGHHQSLGATEWRHMYFRDISAQIKGRPKKIQNEPVDRGGYSAFATLQLNSQVRQYEGFTPGVGVSGRTPEMPIGTVGDPFYNYFRNPANSPVTQTHQVIAKLRGWAEKPLWDATSVTNLTGL